MSVKDKLLKNSTVKSTAMYSDSKILNNMKTYKTSIPILNVALSGKLDGGLMPGILLLAGESKRFKSLFAVYLAKTFLDQEPDGVVLFYDSEFGIKKSYLEKFGIDLNRVIHTPVTDVEQLKHDMVVQLNSIEFGEKVFIMLDSLGAIASKKETEDALEGKSVADMSRAKAIKSLFRLITPQITSKHIPTVIINHVYKEIGLYPKDIVGGGQGTMLHPNDVWIIGRRQEKDGKDLVGYNFIINIEKSRSVKETSKFPVQVTWEKGIHQWSGMFDIALDLGYIKSNKPGWYTIEGEETSFRRKDKENEDKFWYDLFKNTDLQEAIEKEFTL